MIFTYYEVGIRVIWIYSVSEGVLNFRKSICRISLFRIWAIFFELSFFDRPSVCPVTSFHPFLHSILHGWHRPGLYLFFIFPTRFGLIVTRFCLSHVPMIILLYSFGILSVWWTCLGVFDGLVLISLSRMYLISFCYYGLPNREACVRDFLGLF